MTGLVSLQDPPHPKATALIREFHELDIRVIMVTRDRRPTAQANSVPDLTRDVFAEVLPEHRFKLMQVIQNKGHIVGMTGMG